MYKRTPGIKTKFNGVALHPYTGNYQRTGAGDRRNPQRPGPTSDAAKGLWITELGWSSGTAGEPVPTSSPRARRPGARTKGAFTLLSGSGEMAAAARLLVLGRRPPGACNFCDGSGLFDRLRAEEVLDRIREVRRRHPVARADFAVRDDPVGRPDSAGSA